jgi:hypothetical protein
MSARALKAPNLVQRLTAAAVTLTLTGMKTKTLKKQAGTVFNPSAEKVAG